MQSFFPVIDLREKCFTQINCTNKMKPEYKSQVL